MILTIVWIAIGFYAFLAVLLFVVNRISPVKSKTEHLPRKAVNIVHQSTQERRQPRLTPFQKRLQRERLNADDHVRFNDRW